MKSKFKVMDILRLIETVDDYGLVVSLYETSFEATDVALDFSGTKISEEDATFVVESKISQCYEDYTEYGYLDGADKKISYFVGSEFITKIQHDKELQKALLVLIGEGK